jgi:hypothetical protein
MLWVDDDFVTIADLQSMDPEVPDVAQTEGIVLEGSAGVIRRAKEDAQATLSRFMSFGGLSASDLTVRDVNIPTGISELKYNYAGFAQLVVSGEAEDNWSTLKRWVVARTLLRFYRAATNKNADRYSDRFEALQDAIREDYWPSLKRRGLPILFNPLPAPGAIMERAGTFAAANVTLVSGGGASTDEFEFAITWVGSRYVSPADKRNSESYRSARVKATMEAAKVANVSILGLTAPDGVQPEFTRSSCRYTPAVTVGWNVWAGEVDGPLYRQNATVIPIATTDFDLPDDPVLSGEQLDMGQFEDIILEVNCELQRS